MSETTNLRITTVTPVTIGSGVELSPYADYIIDKGQVCFIDKGRMVQRIMQKGDSYLDRYVYGIANGMDNNRSKFDLNSFLLNNQIVQSIDEITFSKCKAEIFSIQTLPIKGIIKSPLSEPYFPGSSIKGALKTVLMYNWLKTNKNADQVIEEVIKGKEIEKNGVKKWVGTSFDSLEKKFECYVNDKNEIVRPKTIQQVTDSKMMPQQSNVVVDTLRAGIPLRFECIAKNQSTEFELTLENYKWEDLAAQANDYATSVLDREFKLVQENEKLIDYYNHLSDVEEMIIKAKNGIAYLRIGFGKGYYLNSLGIAIYDYVIQKGKEKLYDKFEFFIKKEVAKKGKQDDFSLEEFPRTRLMVKKTQEPLGWIKIEKI